MSIDEEYLILMLPNKSVQIGARAQKDNYSQLSKSFPNGGRYSNGKCGSFCEQIDKVEQKYQGNYIHIYTDHSLTSRIMDDIKFAIKKRNEKKINFFIAREYNLNIEYLRGALSKANVVELSDVEIRAIVSLI